MRSTAHLLGRLAGWLALCLMLPLGACDEPERQPCERDEVPSRSAGDASTAATTIWRWTNLAPIAPPASPHHIGNGGMRPPTPTPGFLDERCVSFVERSAGGSLELSVVLASEDREGLGGELEDEHTFQFFATCEPPSPRATMPSWIDVDDVARATMAGLVPTPPSDDDVLSSSAWASLPGHDGVPGTCVVPITEKDGRLPISCEATSDPVAWEVSDVPAGPYWVQAYTYDPPVNEWTPRIGVVVVHDGDPAAVTPWVALTSPTRGATVSPSAPYELRGCAGGAGTGRVVVELARTSAEDLTDPVAWTAIGEVVPGSDDLFSITLDPELLGEDAWNRAYLVRARALDDAGATVASIDALGTLSLRQAAAATDDPSIPVPADWCSLGIDDDDTASSQDEGCRVVADRSGDPWTSWLIPLLAVGALRVGARRRGSTFR